MIAFEDLNLGLPEDVNDFTSGDVIVSVRQYLPIKEKAELIQYVVNLALDETTGCFSPLRVEVYFAMAVCKWYTDIDIDGANQETEDVYDLLDSNGLITAIYDHIPDEELEFLKDLVNDTVADIARYNNSAAGIIRAMSTNTTELNSQLDEALSKMQGEDTKDILSVIKDMVVTG